MPAEKVKVARRCPRGAACVLLAVTLLPAACSSGRSALPLTEGAASETPLASSVFAGRGRAYRFEGGAWRPDPAYDYEFTVLEKRFAGRWEAVKEIHRRHPRYDGRAGPRDQSLYFSVTASPCEASGSDLLVDGTLGRGKGRETAEGIELEIEAREKGWFVPFNTIRIRQRLEASSGRLEETVELLSRKGGKEVPFMKVEEEGTVYRPPRV